ncbi:MAG: hypothetical protein ACTSVB_04500 [Candidatus Heimdallarchaeaceae archaeon]
MEKYLNNIKESVLSILVKYARRSYIKITEIGKLIRDEEEYIWDRRIIDKLAFGYGLLTHITSSINTLRNEGHPILSSDIKGKGYTYAGDWWRPDLADVWDDKFTANEKRKSIPEKEKETDNKLFNKLMKRLTEEQFKGRDVKKVREKLIEVAKKHKLKQED